ncbi:hypothetical protein [Staphylococcus pseudintermedius]|uniref:hypothetical protein n=1 Tax=Staphylococcus pseudintermedius TaxID=283734 RepID=UPI00036D5CB7|nr:hypothetical protein [Staphylococcus pseudintermedius]ANS90310.1 Phage protein [Staphylococcus pseudintermedius]EGQ0369943.1 hypothetical protein [Staphylococcus pseudintermedius]EGQ0382388.1 hypothetical protein [Staphylococcus pseudintermedius]EGQ1293000.1 hypothetical protein [Staphylococcus pseudintermedius]EGQ1659457.1 hypothetical protein [Staphylococcus pseudintermedius]
MRYDKRVDFTIEEIDGYNPGTSKYDKKIAKKWSTMPCNINPLSTSKTVLEFGDVTKGINVLRIHRPIGERPTHAYVNGVKYTIIKNGLSWFYVEEVVNRETKRNN